MATPTHQPRSLGRRQAGFEQLDPHWLIDAAIRASGAERAKRQIGTQWAFIDTRGCDPGTYMIREWVDAAGDPHSVEHPSSVRRGGAIGLFTLQPHCTSVGPCPTGVDEGAGLLLVGFASMLAVPLPDRSTSGLRANWLVILSGQKDAFPDAEVNRLVLLTHALLSDATFIDGCEPMKPSRLALRSSGRAASQSLVRSH